MSAINNDPSGLLDGPEALIHGFVEEYLERTPEYMDVVEFVEENIGEEDEVTDDLLLEVYNGVSAQLDVIAQRYGDEDR